jgi:putative transposase
VSNLRWTADITYVPTGEGWLYRRRSGLVRRLGDGRPHENRLVTDALATAVTVRKHRPGRLHHSDEGSQCTGLMFGQRREEAGIRPSTGRAGLCYDNTVIESFVRCLPTDARGVMHEKRGRFHRR